MAEALFSHLAEQLRSAVYHNTSEALELVLKAKEDVDKFRHTLKHIQNVLHDAEKKQVSDPAVRDWLDELKDVSYKMEDELDAWDTEIGKREAEKQETQGSSDVEVRFPFRPFRFCLPRADGVTRRYKIGSAIKDLNDELTQIFAAGKNFKFQSAAAVEQPHPRLPTTSFPDVPIIYGREDEEKRLVNELLRVRRRGLVIPIVGMGGLGKTALTQLVFKDARVQARFDIKAWVCVSDPFDVIKIAKEILEHVGGEKSRASSDVLQILLEEIKKHIKDKRFLLVLDDVWTEDQTKWERLSLPLLMQSCSKGSRILVTTRYQGVAIMMKAADDMIILEKLSHSDSLKLFYSIAFGGREPDKSNKVFRDIAVKIVGKCDGLPLLLKTLGGLLLYKQTIGEWEEVLNSELWNVERVKDEIFRPLLLSYYDLAPKIKSCLMYCATYPKDFVFDKEILIEQWMSQGYLNDGENNDEETKGREVFTKLVRRCFFQEFKQNALTNEIIGCKMHDTVHDLLKYLTQNECLTMVAMGTQGTETSSANKPPGDMVRHLTLISACDGQFSSSIVNSKILRTLATFDSTITAIESNLISQLKCLRTLNLSWNRICQLPEEIGDLILLRYLDLSYNLDLRRLPDSLCNLFNLQTLRLDHCIRLKALPNSMGKLINLRHLYVDFCPLDYLPKGIRRLSNLRTLEKGACVYCSENAESVTLGDLRMMNQLRCLDIRIISRVGENAASEAEIVELNQKLLHLGLYMASGTDGGVMNALRPHENLDSLLIYYYNGSTWPNWMMTSYLTRLRVIRLCHSDSSVLPPLWRLPSLKVVKLLGMYNLEEIGAEFFGVEEETSSSFPCLETLCLDSLWRLKKWEFGGKAEDSFNSQMKEIMPHLSSLHIVECKKLEQLPDFFLQNVRLQNLLINECESLGRLPDEFISRIPNVTITSDEVFKGRKIDIDEPEE